MKCSDWLLGEQSPGELGPGTQTRRGVPWPGDSREEEGPLESSEGHNADQPRKALWENHTLWHQSNAAEIPA